MNFYTHNTYLPTYISSRSWSVVVSAMDTSAGTADTIQRVDFDFVTPKSGAGKVYALDSTAFYLNYYLGHCPQGVTGVHANTGLLDKKVYTNMDVFYSGNNKGMRMLAAFGAGSNPYFELEVSGADTVIVLDSNWVEVHTFQGIQYYRVLAYQTNGTILDSLAIIWEEGRLKFDVDGSYNTGLGVVWQWDGGAGIIQSSNSIENLVWSSYVGGEKNDYINDICTDKFGNLFFTGTSISQNFPLVNGFSDVFPYIFPSLQWHLIGNKNAIVMKFESHGIPVWATYFGTGSQLGNAISLDDSRNVFVVGTTGVNGDLTGMESFINVPYNYSFGYHHTIPPVGLVSGDNFYGFILKLNQDSGYVTWATPFGEDYAHAYTTGDAVAVDKQGNIFVGGITTNKGDFPLTNTALPSAYFDSTENKEMGYILMFSHTNNLVRWGTLIGSDVRDMVTEGRGDLYAVGKLKTIDTIGFPVDSTDFPVKEFGGGTSDAYAIKFESFTDGLGLKWSTPIGGNGMDFGNSIGLHDSTIYLVGGTQSADFPSINNNNSNSLNDSLLNGSQDGFILAVDNQDYRWSSFVGGNNSDVLNKLSITQFGSIFTIGQSNSPDLHPVELANSYFSELLENNLDTGKGYDAIVLGFNPSLDYDMSFYFGGERYNGSIYSASINSDESGNAIATFSSSTLYIAGSTASQQLFPVTADLSNYPNAYWQEYNCIDPIKGWPINTQYYPQDDEIWDGFIAKFDLNLTSISIKPLKSMQKNELMLFPNPNRGMLNIWMVGSFENIQKVEIFNLFGQIVFSEVYTENGTQFKKIVNLEALPMGVYIVQLTSGNRSFSRKLIIE